MDKRTRPRPTQYPCRVSLVMTEELNEKLNTAADRFEMSFAAVARDILETGYAAFIDRQRKAAIKRTGAHD